jgi:hypothetical protein
MGPTTALQGPPFQVELEGYPSPGSFQHFPLNLNSIESSGDQDRSDRYLVLQPNYMWLKQRIEPEEFLYKDISFLLKAASLGSKDNFLEFSGLDSHGKQVFGFSQGSPATLVKGIENLCWQKPEAWTRTEAMLLLKPYATVIQCFNYVSHMRARDTCNSEFRILS